MPDDNVTTVDDLFVVKQRSLKRFNQDVSVGQLEHALITLSNALKNDTVPTVKTPSGQILARLNNDIEQKEYDLYLLPEARQTFELEKESLSNKLFLADAFALHNQSLELLQKFFPDDTQTQSLTREQQTTNLLLKGTVSSNYERFDERNFWSYRSQLIEHIYVLLGLLKANKEKYDFDSEDLPTKYKLSNEDEIDKTAAIAAALSNAIGRSNQQDTRLTGVTLPESNLPPQEFEPIKRADTPVSTSISTETPALKNVPYQIISLQAGFMYNQVLYDLLAVYGVSNLSIEEISKLPQFRDIENNIRQQIISNLYTLSPEELSGLKLGQRAGLSRKIVQQLLFSKPGFPTYFEQFVVTIPPHLLDEKTRSKIESLATSGGLPHQEHLAKDVVGHYQDYTNPHQNDQTREDFSQLYQGGGFLSKTIGELEREFAYQFEQTIPNLGPQHVLSGAFIIEKILIFQKDPYEFTAHLTPERIGLIFSLDFTPTTIQTEALKSLLIDYWYRYRTLLYKITASDELLTANMDLNSDEFNTILSSISASKGEENLNPESKIVANRITNTALFSRKDEIDRTVEETGSNTKRGQLYSKNWQNVFGADFKRAQIAAQAGNAAAINSLVTQYLTAKNYVLAGQLMAIQQSIALLQTQEALDNQLQIIAATEQLSAFQSHMSPIALNSQVQQTQIFGREPLRSSTVFQGGRENTVNQLAQAGRKTAIKQALKMAGQIRPEIAAALKAKELLDKVVPEENQKYLPIGIGAAALAALMKLMQAVANAATATAFMATGAALGFMAAGPFGALVGGGLGLLSSQALSFTQRTASKLGVTNTNAINALTPDAATTRPPLSLGTPNGLATTTIGGTALVGIGVTMLVIQNTHTAFLLPDTFDQTAVDYLTIQKTASPSTGSPTTVTYTITIAPTGSETVVIRAINDSTTISYNPDTRADGGPAQPPPSDSFDVFLEDARTLMGQAVPSEGTSFSYQVPFDERYNDAAILNQLEILYDVQIETGTLFNQRQIAKATVCFGDCPQDTFCWPVTGNITQLPFSTVKSHQAADAYDIGAPIGTRVYAPISGDVCDQTGAPSFGAFGNHVILKASDGNDYVFAHLSNTPIENTCADPLPVIAGEVIGFVGSTGNSSGPHLHFEISRNGGYDRATLPSILETLVPRGAEIKSTWSSTNLVGVESCYD